MYTAKDKYRQNPVATTAVEKPNAIPEIEQIIVDRSRRPHKQYLKGRFLGKVS